MSKTETEIGSFRHSDYLEHTHDMLITLIDWSMQQLRPLHAWTVQFLRAAATMQQSLQTCLGCLLHLYRTLAAIAAAAMQLEIKKSTVCTHANVWYRIGARLKCKHHRGRGSSAVLSKDARAFILSARSKQPKSRARIRKQRWMT